MTYHTLKGETSALKDIKFNVEEGEFLSIIGPSGCGKSTILNIIAGLLSPSSGKIYIDNKEIKNCNNRSEEHTSELQSRQYLVCRLLLEKKHQPTHSQDYLAQRLVPPLPSTVDFYTY